MGGEAAFLVLLACAGGAFFLYIGYKWGYLSGASYGENQVKLERRASEQKRLKYEREAREYVSKEEARITKEKQSNEADLLTKKKEFQTQLENERKIFDKNLLEKRKELIGHLITEKIQLKKERENFEAELSQKRQTFNSQLIKERNDFKSELKQERLTQTKKLIEERKRLEEREAFIINLESAFNQGFLNGRKWLASMIAAASAKVDTELEDELRSARNAPRAADIVQEIKIKKRALKEENAFLKYELKTIKEYFPLIAEFEEDLLEDRLHIPRFEADSEETEEIKEGKEGIDPARKYLSDEEWEKLSIRERNQLALDRYKKRHFSKAEIGRFYERQLGCEFEQQGYKVKYFGIEKGLEDLGRDLVCIKRKTTIIVQAKCWSNEKTIHEKHIYQLFGTTTTYRIEHPNEKVEAHFYTTTSLSIVAKEAADRLGIHVHENYALNKDYPIIKCNVGANGEKIYHLPFDQQYDKTQIRKAGERYVTTVAEAERFGFRRAKRWFGTTS